MSHPPGWSIDEPCPSCGSRDITGFAAITTSDEGR